jgi:hypothetical protein
LKSVVNTHKVDEMQLFNPQWKVKKQC